MARSRASAVVSSALTVLLSIGLLASVQGQGQSPARGGANNAANAANGKAAVSQSVRNRIASAGSARVLVELRIPGGPQPEAKLAKSGGQNAVQGQRRNINAVRAQALARIPAPQRREIRHYDTLPLVALEIGPAALATLESSPDVVRIMPDTVL